MALTLSRRLFARTLGTGLGAAIFGPHLVDAPAEARVPKGQPEDAIQLNSNENPYGPAPAALDAMTASQKVAARYPDAAEKRLVEAIAAMHKLDPDQVLLGCGSGELLRVADMAFLGADKTVVAAEPTFEAVLNYARVARGRAVTVPQTADFRHDLAAMAAACDATTGLVYVCNPNNPTGTIVRRAELSRFLEQVPKTVHVLLDEAYFHFVEDEEYASGLEWISAPNLIVVRTFSKIYGMAGMRLGYAVGSKENVAAMRQHLISNNTNAAVLPAALAALADPELVPAQRALNKQTREWLCRELERDGRRYIPSHTNFLMIELGGDVAPAIEAFRNEGILVGRKFPAMGSWLRVSMGTRQEMEAFVAGLRRIVPAAQAA
jgi:histidinol-phosphate aminotransferase